MLQAISRDEFLALVGVKSTTLDQRIHTGEAAFALGVSKPAHIAEYLALDAVAMILASLLNCFAGLTLRQAADEVREHWDEWLTLLARVERWAERWAERHQGDPMLCFAIAWLSLEPRRYRVVLGDTAEIAKALRGEHLYTTNFVSIARALHHLRANARAAKISLPKRLTIDPDDKPAYAKWRSEIDLYQQAAGARLARDKPARPPVRKRLLQA